MAGIDTEGPDLEGERHLRLDGPVNFRDLGGYAAADGTIVRWRTIFRSDGLETLSSDDRRRLLDELRLGVVIDLRSPREVADRGAFSAEGTSVRVCPVPILDDTAAVLDLGKPFRMASLLNYMVESCSDRFVAALRLMSTAEGPLVFHCAAGKDRTGLLAGLLLLLLGVAERDVVVDYGYSRDAVPRLRRRRQRRVAAGQIDATTAVVGDSTSGGQTSGDPTSGGQTSGGQTSGHPTATEAAADSVAADVERTGRRGERGGDPAEVSASKQRRRALTAELFSAEPDTLAEVLAFVRDRHGSIEGWAADHGFGADDLAALRNRLLEPANGAVDRDRPTGTGPAAATPASR